MHYKLAANVKELTPEQKYFWTGNGVSTNPDLAVEYFSKGAAESQIKKMSQLHLADSMVIDGAEVKLNFQVERCRS
jgi:hypothetical protein